MSTNGVIGGGKVSEANVCVVTAQVPCKGCEPASPRPLKSGNCSHVLCRCFCTRCFQTTFLTKAVMKVRNDYDDDEDDSDDDKDVFR